ncbi:unnamed protein product [Clonostachys rosea f. rosea IK726]|uniref:Uncharacterized protein n=1 Tax=Clonostachys rosea f. rosea IK726 TaxID=1349383 RepID=A0ACA9UE56_BIOOC|nr:unnamed protein product [Clonostachys rosea f. rosea IK726]
MDPDSRPTKNSSVCEADIGYPDGFVFVAGMLNGAFAMGTPDATVHLAEEIPFPGRMSPKPFLLNTYLAFSWLSHT